MDDPNSTIVLNPTTIDPRPTLLIGKPGPVREAIMVLWRLDTTGRPPNVGMVAEVEAVFGTVLGAATPTEGFKRLVSRQSTGAEITAGSWAGVGVSAQCGGSWG